MSPQKNAIVLASGSPRRRELLDRAGVRFEVVESGVDEVIEGEEPADRFALRMAREKALAVSRKIPDAIVLGADTVVEYEGEIMLKPVDRADAARMLSRLSGVTHTVTTAFALARDGELLAAEPVASRVTFRKLSPEEIESYVATGEPMDKAGAYGIQGLGGTLIVHVEGPRDNVMGLPVRKVLAALNRIRAI
ncbi:MAG TPA: Maf family protein [Candidatus Binataceae bacterium]|nr:Maf family protein [Candidatus Binataceae bacterium]